MTKQSEALRLADALDEHQFDEPHAAAAELRRLEIQRDALLEALKFYENAGSELSRLMAQRDQLLKALKKIEAIEDQMFGPDWEEIEEARGIARAAIKAVEE